MGDGQRKECGLVLCTDSYTIKEVVFLVNVLIIRYNLICTIRETNLGQYRIYITQKSMDNLRAIILPYMQETMLYKLNIHHKKKSVWTKIFINNTITGENLHYESISSAAKAIDVSRITIKKISYIKKVIKKHILYKRRRIFRKHYSNI